VGLTEVGQGGPQRMDTDIEQDAAAQFRPVADVRAGQPGNGERGLESPQFPDHAPAYQPVVTALIRVS
jgi:hypothetical protein